MKNEQGSTTPKIQPNFALLTTTDATPTTEDANLSAALTPQSHLDSVSQNLDFTIQPSGSFNSLNNGWM